jgi:hypothetical protein
VHFFITVNRIRILLGTTLYKDAAKAHELALPIIAYNIYNNDSIRSDALGLLATGG